MPKIKTSIRSSLVKQINDSAKKTNSPLRGKLDGAIKRVSDEADNLSSVVDGIAITEAEFGKIVNKLSKESMSKLMDDFLKQMPTQGLSKQSLSANAEDITTIQATLLRLEQMLKEGDSPEGVEVRKEDALIDDRLKNLKELQQEIDRGAQSDEARIGEYLRREKRYRVMQTQRGGKPKSIGDGGTLPAALYDAGKNKLTQFAQKQGIFKDLDSVNQGIFGHASILTAPLFKAAGWAVNSGISGVLDPKHSLLGRMGTSLKDKLLGDRKKDEEKEDFKELAITQTDTLEDIKNLLQHQEKKKGGIVRADKDKKEDEGSILPWILGIGAVAIGATVYEYFTDPKFKTWLDDNVLKPVYGWVSDKWETTAKPWLTEQLDNLADFIVDSAVSGWNKRRDAGKMGLVETAAYATADALSGFNMTAKKSEDNMKQTVVSAKTGEYINSMLGSRTDVEQTAAAVASRQNVAKNDKYGWTVLDNFLNRPAERGTNVNIPENYKHDYIQFTSDLEGQKKWLSSKGGKTADNAYVVDKEKQAKYLSSLHAIKTGEVTDLALKDPLKYVAKAGLMSDMSTSDVAYLQSSKSPMDLAAIAAFFGATEDEASDTEIGSRFLDYSRGKAVPILNGKYMLDPQGQFATEVATGNKVKVGDLKINNFSGAALSRAPVITDAYALQLEALQREQGAKVPMPTTQGLPITVPEGLQQLQGIPQSPTVAATNNVTYITNVKGNEQEQDIN